MRTSFRSVIPFIVSLMVSLAAVAQQSANPAAGGAAATAPTGTPAPEAAPPSTPREQLLHSFALLDRVFIPALYATAAGDTEAAGTSISALVTAWEELRSRHSSVPFDSKWKETVSTVTSRLEKARQLQKEDALEEAYYALGEIRDALVECRSRNSMKYFPDGLATYGAELEKILQEISMAGVARPVTAVREELRRRLVPAASRAYATARKVPVDPALHGFDTAKEGRLKQLIQKQQQLLDDLADATEEGSTDAVFDTAKQLKPNFDRLYRIFGTEQD